MNDSQSDFSQNAAEQKAAIRAEWGCVLKQLPEYAELFDQDVYKRQGQLRAEGNTQYDLVPCIVVDVQGIDLPLSDELKELYVLTTTNAEQREKTDYDLMLQVQNLSRIYTELKAAGYPLRGRQRDMKMCIRDRPF